MAFQGASLGSEHGVAVERIQWHCFDGKLDFPPGLIFQSGFSILKTITMNEPQGSRVRQDERFLFGIAVLAAILFGAGYVFLMVALHHREANPLVPVASQDAVPLAPDRDRELVNFSLTESCGRTITRADLEGKFVVVDFLFTSCSLTCPRVNSQMASIQTLTVGQSDVRLVSITVDPRDDTPEVLRDYGREFGADTNRWWFLTGEKSVLYQLIGQSFLNADLNDPFSYMPGNWSHTERIAVVDPRGNIRAYFDGLAPNAAAAVVAEIARLRQ